MKSAEDYDKACSFCAIARGLEHPPEVIAEDERWLAFVPLNPATPGHTLVVPRSHVRDLWELPAELHGTLMAAVVDVGSAIQRALSPDGMNLITSAGSVAEQTVFHLHLHLVPRWRRDGFGRIWPLDARYENEQLDDAADRIRLEVRRSE